MARERLHSRARSLSVHRSVSALSGGWRGEGVTDVTILRPPLRSSRALAARREDFTRSERVVKRVVS